MLLSSCWYKKILATKVYRRKCQSTKTHKCTNYSLTPQSPSTIPENYQHEIPIIHQNYSTTGISIDERAKLSIATTPCTLAAITRSISDKVLPPKHKTAETTTSTSPRSTNHRPQSGANILINIPKQIPLPPECKDLHLQTLSPHQYYDLLHDKHSSW
jgi:hypothetical protein